MPKVHHRSITLICKEEPDPKEDKELQLYLEAATWAVDRFIGLRSQVSGIFLHLDRYRVVVDGGSGCEASEDDEDALGFFAPVNAEVHVATKWANTPKIRPEIHSSPLDVCYTLFHEVGHSLQHVAGTLVFAERGGLDNEVIEMGADDFATRALGEFVVDRYIKLKELMPHLPSNQAQPRMRKKGKKRTEETPSAPARSAKAKVASRRFSSSPGS